MTPDDFEKYLNDVHADIDVLGVKFPVGTLLRRMSLALFQQGAQEYAEWENELIDRQQDAA